MAAAIDTAYATRAAADSAVESSVSSATRYAVYSAVSAASFTAGSSDFAGYAADSATSYAADSATSYAVDAATLYSADSAAQAAVAGAVLYSASLADSLFDAAQILTAPLWPDGPPEGLRPQDIGETLLDTDPHFAFWKRWYEGMVAGRPLDWELQRRIALIDDAIWKEGASDVAREIERIEEEWLAESLPQADRVLFDESQNLFRTEPTVEPSDALVARVLKQIDFSLSLMQGSNCGLNSTSTAWRYIRFALDDCRDDANALEQNFDLAHKDLTEGLVQDRYFDDSHLSALSRALEQAVSDLRAFHPEVAEAYVVRSHFKIKDMQGQQKEQAIAHAGELANLMADKAAQELKMDMETAVHGGGETSKIALRRLLGRLAQIRILLRTSRVVQAINENTGYQAATLLLNAISLSQLLMG